MTDADAPSVRPFIRLWRVGLAGAVLLVASAGVWIPAETAHTRSVQDAKPVAQAKDDRIAPVAVPVVTVAVDPVAPAPEAVAPEAQEGVYVGTGVASYYGSELEGNRTASGERFDPDGLTAAHRTLPLGSRIRVINERNGESVIVRVNDRGPFTGDRVLDVSEGAAREIGMIRRGTARVRIERLPKRRG